MQDYIDLAEKNGVTLLDAGPCQFCGAVVRAFGLWGASLLDFGLARFFFPLSIERSLSMEYWVCKKFNFSKNMMVGNGIFGIGDSAQVFWSNPREVENLLENHPQDSKKASGGEQGQRSLELFVYFLVQAKK